MENIEFLFEHISEQKSIFKKEQNTFDRLIGTIIDEWKTGRNQIVGVAIFIVTAIFTMLEFKWIDESTGIQIISATLVITMFLAISYELIRYKFLIIKLSISLKYDDGLWTISEIKRSLITYHLISELKFNYPLYLTLIQCIIAAERIHQKKLWNEVMKSVLFRKKKLELEEYHKSSEHIIVMAKGVYDDLHKEYEKDPTMKELLFLLQSLKNYKKDDEKT